MTKLSEGLFQAIVCSWQTWNVITVKETRPITLCDFGKVIDMLGQSPRRVPMALHGIDQACE